MRPFTQDATPFSSERGKGQGGHTSRSKLFDRRSAWRSGWPGGDCAGRPQGRDEGSFIRGNEVLPQKLIWKQLPFGSFPPLGLVIQPELFAFPAEGVAMNPQSLGCPGLVSVVLFEHALDKPLLEFGYGVGKLNSLFNHGLTRASSWSFTAVLQCGSICSVCTTSELRATMGLSSASPFGFPSGGHA